MTGRRTEAQKVERKAYDQRRRAEGLASNKRDIQGVTATLREQDSGERYTLARFGYLHEAIQEIADWCDAHEGDWRVLCLSTPNTIKADLRGHRVTTRFGGVAHTVCPENHLLGTVGRHDLLDPSLP